MSEYYDRSSFYPDIFVTENYNHDEIKEDIEKIKEEIKKKNEYLISMSANTAKDYLIGRFWKCTKDEKDSEIWINNDRQELISLSYSSISDNVCVVHNYNWPNDYHCTNLLVLQGSEYQQVNYIMSKSSVTEDEAYSFLALGKDLYHRNKEVL